MGLATQVVFFAAYRIEGTKPMNTTYSAAKPSILNATPDDILLDVREIGISFGGLKAVQSFSIRLPRGGLCGLIGPNGAGKTTVFNLLTGVYQTTSGTM